MRTKFLPYWITPEILKAAGVMACMLFVVSYAVDFTLARIDVTSSSTILNDIAIAMIATGVMLFYLLATHTQHIFLRAKERMNLIAELNHHLSRALVELHSAAEVEDRDERLRKFDQTIEYMDYVLIELVPKVFGESSEHQWQGKGCLPIESHLPKRPFPSAEVDDRANQRPVEKTEHCVVALMMAHAGVIDVMGEARNKAMFWRSR